MGYRYEKRNLSQISLDHRPWPFHLRHKPFRPPSLPTGCSPVDAWRSPPRTLLWEVVELYEGLADEGRRLAKQMLRALPQAS